MKLQTAIKRATEHLMRSEKARTYTVDIYGETHKYVLHLSRNTITPDVLKVENWGFDYEEILIPQTRQDVIKLKTLAQLAQSDYVSQVALRYYLDILHRESNS